MYRLMNYLLCLFVTGFGHDIVLTSISSSLIARRIKWFHVPLKQIVNTQAGHFTIHDTSNTREDTTNGYLPNN